MERTFQAEGTGGIHISRNCRGPGVRKVWQQGVDRQAEMNACGESWSQTERLKEPEKIIGHGESQTVALEVVL